MSLDAPGPALHVPGKRLASELKRSTEVNLFAIRRASPDDANALTRLMLSSAAYFGRYASILEGYAVTPAQIEKDVFYVAEQDGTIVAFYCLTLDGEPELDLMFVADGVQGAGVGSSMFKHMRDQARRRGISAIKIVSHPPSVDFYRKMGATVVGMKAATLTARWERPILVFPVND